MKNLFLITMLLLIPLLSSAQYMTGVKGFYHKYKKSDNAQGFVLPGFMVWLGAGIAKSAIDEPEAKIALRFMKKFKTMRFLIMEDGHQVTDEDYLQLVYSAQKQNYEPMISVREKGQDIQIFAKGKKDKLKRLLILVKSEDEFVMMDMKTKIRTKDLNRLINDLMKLEKVRNKIKPMPEEDKKLLKEKLEKEKLKARA